MMTIIIPPELGINAPLDMPFIELAIALANKGYTLRNSGGNLVAVKIEKIHGYVNSPAYKAEQAERNYRATKLMEAASVYKPPLSDDKVMDCCGKKRIDCVCNKSND